MSETHERTDIEPKHALAFAAGLVIFIGFVFGISLGVFRYFAPSATRATSVSQPEIESGFQKLPEPRLQVSPAEDLAKVKNSSREKLESYGWVDRDSKTVRIPIERAIDFVAERGVPDFTRQVEK
jgi:hypothetical protein